MDTLYLIPAFSRLAWVHTIHLLYILIYIHIKYIPPPSRHRAQVWVYSRRDLFPLRSLVPRLASGPRLPVLTRIALVPSPVDTDLYDPGNTRPMVSPTRPCVLRVLRGSVWMLDI